MSSSLTVLILTFNESKHIERCVHSLRSFASRICICDSFSTDDTLALAESLGCEVKQNKWVNYATQYNWALDNFEINSRWVMRMDADEYVTDELALEIRAMLSNATLEISHFYVKRQVHFLGRWIKYGDYYPIWLLRLWRDPAARCESRWMDEHIKVEGGKSARLTHDIVDANDNDLTWWTNKHNNYATREAADLLNTIYTFRQYDDVAPKLFASQEKRKRWLKVRYASMPLFVRPFLYYFYRYIIKLGFLDGKQGLVWHFLQGFWYRFLVDAKIYEAYKKVGKDRASLQKYMKEKWSIDFNE